MELKAGYKQTEVGVIPEDWAVSLMGSLGSFSKGAGIRKDDASSGNIPCVRYGEIYTHHNNIIRFFNSWISREVAMSSKRLRKGDLLFAGSSETKEEIGKCVAFIDDTETYAGGDIVIFTPIRGSSHFFGYLFNSPVVQRQKAAKGQGDAVVHISSTALSSIRIPLPPTIAEQRAIAVALSDVDALIESLDRLIAKKRDIKQAAMQGLLRPKDSWIVKRLVDIANIKTGCRNNQDKTEDGEYPFFVRSATIERINCYSYDCEAILVPGEGSIGNIFHYVVGRFDVHQRVYAITQFTRETSGKYVYFYMTQYFGVHAMKNSVKATVDSLRLPTFENFEISMPSTLEEQQAIATVLSDMDAEITALERKRDKTRLLKQGMMQELLTGRIRLVKPENRK
jgi:type I restriction enzyme S subunit